MKVIDSSVALAFFLNEPQADAALAVMTDGTMSIVQLSETVQKVSARGLNADHVIEGLLGAGVAFDEPGFADAIEAARLYGNNGLSSGDRFCIAAAMRLGLPVVTADRAWAEARLPVAVELIR